MSSNALLLFLTLLQKASSDAGTGVDAQLRLRQLAAQTEAGVGNDSEAISKTKIQSDAATGTDSEAIVKTKIQSEAASATDTQAIVKTKIQSEAATGSDTHVINKRLTVQSDAASGTDTQAIAKTKIQSDSGSANEAQQLIRYKTSKDMGVGDDVHELNNVTQRAPSPGLIWEFIQRRQRYVHHLTVSWPNELNVRVRERLAHDARQHIDIGICSLRANPFIYCVKELTIESEISPNILMLLSGRYRIKARNGWIPLMHVCASANLKRGKQYDMWQSLLEELVEPENVDTPMLLGRR